MVVKPVVQPVIRPVAMPLTESVGEVGPPPILRAAQQDANINSYVTFPGFTGPAIARFEFRINIPSGQNQFIVLTSISSRFVFAATQGSSDTSIHGGSVGTPILYIDGSEFTGTTRGDVWDAIPKDTEVLIQVADADGFANPNPGRTNYTSGSFAITAKFREFKINWTGGAGWDAQSELGNDNGFTWSNITEVDW